MSDSDELRRELADVVASVRAYLEQQAASGATAIPRGPGPARPMASSAAGLLPTPSPTRVASLTPSANRAASPAPSPVPAELPATREPPLHVSDHSTDPRVRLPELAREIAGCTRCVLARTRTQTVFARGNPEASVCFIGEAPGADEDAQGLPFVGRAGQLLDRMIHAMGLSPERDVYVVNIIRCRPPENRKPEPSEIASCLPYLEEQLDLVRPKVIVALGNTAVSSLFQTKLGISKLRGQWKLYRGRTPLMPTYHPSYLLRPGPQQAEAKKQAWEDLQAVLKELQLPVPTPKKRGEPRSGEEPS